MKILLAGMHNTDNQFGRAIAKYGCEVVHTDGDAGRVPINCDAAVIVKCHISHKKFEQVKDTYKALKRPIFVASFGFTQIKEEFEGYIAKAMPPPVLRVPERPKVNSFTNAPSIVKEDAQMAMKILPTEDTDKIKQIIAECHGKGLGNPEIVAAIIKAGLKKASGDDVDANYVAGLKFKMSRDGTLRSRIPELDEQDERYIPPEERYIPPEDRQVSPEMQYIGKDSVDIRKAITQENSEEASGRQLALIGKVLGSNLSQERILRLVKRIQSGEIMSEESVTAMQAKTEHGAILQITRTSIFADKETPLLTLSRVQAMAIAQVWDKVEDFATGED